jgi:hypothetical protein
MTKFILVKTSFERGGARFLGVKAIGSYDTLQMAQDAAQEFFRNYWFDDESECPQMTWKTSEGQVYAVDFEDFSDFNQFTIDQVEA